MRKYNLKSGWQIIAEYRSIAILAVLTVAVGGLLFNQTTENTVEASSPLMGTINAVANDSETWTGDIVNPGTAANGEPSCIEANPGAASSPGDNCDSYTLVVAPGDWSDKQIRIQIADTLPVTDYDMVVREESNNQPGLQGDGVNSTINEPGDFDQTAGTSGNAAGSVEEVTLSPPDSGTTYYVRAIYFAGGGSADNYRASAQVIVDAADVFPVSACEVPTYDNYTPPVGHPRRDGSGEPSIGVNWNTGNVMAMSRLTGQRVTFDDSTSPAAPTTGETWFARTTPILRTGLDPILFTDSITGRTIAGELSGNFTIGFISDDDFSTISESFQAVTSASSIDHQTIGGGPAAFDPNDPVLLARQPLTSYPHLFYYAAQNIGYADVSTSFDGGLTYQQAIPAYTLTECNGLHGHIRVAPDGTVYLPNKNCGGQAAVVVSEDNGLTWNVRPIPSSSAGDNDPSVGIGAGGRLFVGYTASDKSPRVAISDDRGLTWHDDINLGLGVTPNLTAAVFPEAIAGDNDRAAVFFLGTTSTNPGDPTGTDNGGNGPNFAGTWYPYMATTCDGGKSWTVVKADNNPIIPNEPNPVQQGVVCTNGTTCPGGPPNTRNLLDFNEITVDSRGRVLAAYADGCGIEHPCHNINDNSGTRVENQGNARLTIIRQRGGVRLFSAFDPAGPAAPSLSPPVQVEQSKNGYALTWATPADGGSPLTSYKVYRGLPGGSEQMIAEVSGSQNSFVDRRYGSRNNRGIYYRVTATNKFGESPRNVKFYAKDGIRTKADKDATKGRGLGE